MILKASQRGGAKALGVHLLKAENEHVEVHEIRGFASDNLMGAMKEAYAVAKGTRCQQFLFSVSLNPPETAAVGTDAFEAAIARIEEKMGLVDQPRMIVFHEKEGRRHAHAVWSRIDADTMTARPMSLFKTKLREVSKSLYLEHGWQMPRGLMDSKERDPRNFSLAEWQQAKRMGRNPRALKAAIQDCWAVSDSCASFAQALESRGLYLAKGDARAHVAITYEGEVVSIPRMVGIKARQVTAKLGKADDLRSVADARAHIAATVAPRLGQLIGIAGEARAREMAPLEEKRIAMKENHALERVRLDEGQKARSITEARQRAARLRGGVAGLWDRMTGQHGRVTRENETDAFAAFRRDRDQRNGLVADQLNERRTLQCAIVAVRHRYTARVTELYRDLARQAPDHGVQREHLRDSFGEAARSKSADGMRDRFDMAARGGERAKAGRGRSCEPGMSR